MMTKTLQDLYCYHSIAKYHYEKDLIILKNNNTNIITQMKIEDLHKIIIEKQQLLDGIDYLLVKHPNLEHVRSNNFFNLIPLLIKVGYELSIIKKFENKLIDDDDDYDDDDYDDDDYDDYYDDDEETIALTELNEEISCYLQEFDLI